MSWHLFLDESGDLGFDFENKNPSRLLTITILAISQPQAVKAIRSAVKKTLARKVNGRRKQKRPHQELKGCRTSIAVKRYFYNLIKDEKFGVYAMSLNKRRVHDELHQTPRAKDRLYNFVARQVIDAIPWNLATDSVELVVDKSKGKSGIADFDSYLVRQLEGRLDPRASLVIRHRDSCTDGCLSAVDQFCWGVFRRRENADEKWYSVFKSKVLLDEQYL